MDLKEHKDNWDKLAKKNNLKCVVDPRKTEWDSKDFLKTGRVLIDDLFSYAGGTRLNNKEKSYSENRFSKSRIFHEFNNLFIDSYYGVSLLGTVPSSNLNHTYVSNTDYSAIDWALSYIEKYIELQDVIVDIGCGKGRVINSLLSKFNHNVIIGIEYEKEISAILQERLSNFSNVKIYCDDATSFIPLNGQYFYMFNPFTNEETMDRFIDNFVNKSFSADRNRIKILYYCPRQLRCFKDNGNFDIKEYFNPDLVPWKVNNLYRSLAVISFKP